MNTNEALKVRGLYNIPHDILGKYRYINFDIHIQNEPEGLGLPEVNAYGN